MRRFATPLLLPWLLAGCSLAARPARGLPPLEREGEVYLYVNPFPAAAARISFTVAGLAAVAEDGALAPLEVVIREVKGADMIGQRLLAWGRLPPGAYAGLAFRVGEASLATDEGPARLQISEAPERLEVPFRVTVRGALVLSLTWRQAESVGPGFAFTPSFSVVVPAAPTAQLVGLCTSTAWDALTVFDRRARRVTGVVPTGRGPQGVALDAAAGRAYVALSEEDQVDVVDVAAAASVGRIRLRAGDRPRDVALAPGGRLLLVLNPGSRTVSFVDPVTRLELGREPVGEDPVSLLVDRTGTRGYVANRRSHALTVLDLANRRTAATVPTDPEPLRAALNRAGTRLYLVHAGAASMTVLSVPELQVATRVHVGPFAAAVKVDPRTDLVYVAKADTGRLEVYDAFSALPVDDFDAGGAASQAAIDDAESAIFLLVPSSRTIEVVDLTSRRRLGRMEVGPEPHGLAMAGERN
jgi:YVTN family beta-propeller protein